ncbi:MAG: PEGA domain-containing protein [Defluviitaleaceae bacterium]|nr:PEGA domain-containing protein [Defluviitaleaceae bacterium]
MNDNDRDKYRQRTDQHYELEGVYYTPSNEANRRQPRTQRQSQISDRDSIHRKQAQSKKNQNGKQSRGRSSQKSQLSVYYIVALLVSVSVCVAAVAILINSFASGGGNNAPVDPGQLPSLPVIGSEEDDNATFTNIVAVVISASEGAGGVEVVDVYTETTHRITVDAGTRMSDRFDRPLVLEEFSPGNIIDISFNENTSVIRTMRINVLAWERRLVRNVRVDAAASTITLGNDVFRFGPDTVTNSRGQHLDIARISGIDLLNVRGYRDKAWHIELVSGSGVIEVRNTAAIRNGTIEIGTNVLHALEDVEDIEILAGYHRVVVRGDNIELFVEEIEVIEGERQVLDLSRARLLNGVLEITSNVTGFRAYVDGIEVSLLAPIPLEFGEYSLRVVLDGHEPYETQVIINSEIIRVHATLNRIINMGNLIIETTPIGASVFIDDIFRGNSPVTIPLEYGGYMLRVTLPEHQEREMFVEISDREHRINFSLFLLEDLWLD